MAYGLGRGLSSLIPQKNKKEGEKIAIREDEYHASITPAVATIGILEVPIEKIDPNPRQPRKTFDGADIAELAESLKEYGIIQPLVVIPNNDRYELVVGERRLRAARLAGFTKVPAVVKNYDEQKKLEVALIENIQREDLNPVEKALAYRDLQEDFNLTVEEVARRVGKSRPQVSNTMRLLSLPEEIRQSLMSGQLTEAHAVYLLGLENPIRQMEVFRKIIQNNWTVRETSRQVRRLGGTKESRIKENPADRSREAIFRSFFSAKTEIKRSNRGGQVIINFLSDDELDGMVGKIKN
jgi:ParB family transcriptional regulator, chromosome partitioning protein